MVGKYVYAVRVGNREWQALLAAAPGPGLHASQRVRLARTTRTVMVMLMPVKGLFLAATIICYGVYFLDKVKEEDRDQTEIHYYSAKCCLYCECDGDKREVAGHRLVCR